MKFDIVVGNPPYNGEVNENSKSSSPIYNLFVEKSMSISNRYVLMITPSRWMIRGKGLTNFRKKMMKDLRIKLIVDDISCNSIFKDVQISGGVSYFLWDNEYNGACNFNGVLRYLDEFEIVLRENESRPILRKVKLHSSAWISSSCSTCNPYGLESNVVESIDGVPCWYKKRIGLRRVSPEIVRGDVSAYRILVPRALPGGGEQFLKNGRFFNSSRIVIAAPGEYCTGTFIVVHASDGSKEALNFLSYLHTKFFRFMLRMGTVSQDINRKNYMFVPDLIDYSKTWSDKDLYKMFDLTVEEIQFIESKIKD